MKKEKHIELQAKDISEMTFFEMARWLSLVEAVDVIAEKAEDRKINMEDVDFKPLAIQKYVEATCDSICKSLQESAKSTSTA